MGVDPNLKEIVTTLLSNCGLQLVSVHPTQSLWAGYGHICEVTAVKPTTADIPSPRKSAGIPLILKYISPPISKDSNNEGHLRKILSYQVEQYFYTHLAPTLPENVSVAECFASINQIGPKGEPELAMVLQDLRAGHHLGSAFPVTLEKRAGLGEVQSLAAIDWLAGFHGHFWTRIHDMDRSKLVRPPLKERSITIPTGAMKGKTVWLNGGYTYLSTRRSEYASLASDASTEWSHLLCCPVSHQGESVAELVAAVLEPSPTHSSEHETLLHGDVKSENMFASEPSPAQPETRVALFDFQYVGLGLGVCDLAKLMTCSIPLEFLTSHSEDSMPAELDMQGGEQALLIQYLQALVFASGKRYSWALFVRHWEAALVDWLRFQASWGFWGNTAWLEARVRFILKDSEFRAWLLEQQALRPSGG